MGGGTETVLNDGIVRDDRNAVYATDCGGTERAEPAQSLPRGGGLGGEEKDCHAQGFRQPVRPTGKQK